MRRRHERDSQRHELWPAFRWVGSEQTDWIATDRVGNVNAMGSDWMLRPDWTGRTGTPDEDSWGPRRAHPTPLRTFLNFYTIFFLSLSLSLYMCIYIYIYIYAIIYNAFRQLNINECPKVGVSVVRCGPYLSGADGEGPLRLVSAPASQWLRAGLPPPKPHPRR